MAEGPRDSEAWWPSVDTSERPEGDRVRWFRKKEVPLFRTYQPPFRAVGWAVGEVVQHEGRLYRVTRWVELPTVQLHRGGSVSEWEIWGARLSDSEMRAELLDAVERIKDGTADKRDDEEADSELGGG
jgi:hypothetical protein